MQKIWVTKFALTKGIVVADAEVSGTTAIVKGGVPWVTFRFGKDDWFPNAHDAEVRARKVRDLKVASLRREADRLAELEFTAPSLV